MRRNRISIRGLDRERASRSGGERNGRPLLSEREHLQDGWGDLKPENDSDNRDDDGSGFGANEPGWQEAVVTYGGGYSCKMTDMSPQEKIMAEAMPSCNFCGRPNCSAQDNLDDCANSRYRGSGSKRPL